MVCLGNKQRSFFHFWNCTQVQHLDSFVDCEGYSISSNGFLPTVVDIMDSREIKSVSPKGNQPWIFVGRTDAEAEAPINLATWCEELTHWKRSWYFDRLREAGEWDNRGWDNWMAWPTQWTWVWENSGRQWKRTGKPGRLQSSGSQRVGHDLVTEQQ